MKRFLLTISIILISFLLVSCNDDVFSKAFDNLNIPGEITSELILPKEDKSLGVIFEWTSNKPNIIGLDGTLYLQDEDQVVTLTVVASFNNTIKTKQFEITVKSFTSKEIINAWDYFNPKLPSVVYRNYTKFNEDEHNGVTIRYESTNQNIITNEGVITQLLVDQVVTINCYLSYKGMVKMYSKEMTIAKLSETAVISLVNSWVPEQFEAFNNGEISVLPTKHPDYGTNIRWTSTDPEVLVVDGYILKTPKTSFTLYCEIILGPVVRQYYFTVTNFTGGFDVETILDNWLPTLIPTKIIGSKNFVKADDHLDYQIRTNIGGVLNELIGKDLNITEDLIGTNDESYLGRVASPRKFVDQAKLNELFYEGYQKPNNLDIIWIVVHESGMPQVGNTASKLNEIMHRKMVSNEANSSWHYSVDAFDIFHHIPNHLGAWHASDGSTTGGGNRNGIGIEMCINQDGNYEGSLHNDAKLIAYLMHEYNLSLINIRRHYDFAPDKKQCPYYMIETNRWHEFLDLVNREYIAISLLKDAIVTWHHTRPELFVTGDNNLFYNLEVAASTNVEVTLTVNKGNYQFSQTKTLVLGGN